MKNLLNCHTKGLHSFSVSFENGLYRRIFITDPNHNMWREDEIAIHPHHVDIKITVLEGILFNPIYSIGEDGELYNKYIWDSHILRGNGGFRWLGYETIQLESNKLHRAGEVISMKACELHTVIVPKEKKCVWLIEESEPTCEYIPINYSKKDLTKWSADGLYIEVDDVVKQKYVGEYLSILV